MECLFFHEKGEGKPVILIHGLGLNHSIWNPIFQLLASRFRVILPDMRAHGKSFSIETDFSFEDMGKDVVRMMDKLNIPSAVIAGHSMGGYASLSILKEFPDRIHGIALIASHIYADSEIKRELRMTMAERLATEEPEDVFRGMLEKLSQHSAIADRCKEMIKQTDAVGIRSVLRAMARRPSSEEIWKLNNKPSMIVTGRKDSFIHSETVRKMALVNENAVIHEVDDTGHMAMMEKPDIISTILEKFLENI